MSRRVALLGSRGIPARYGGFETLLEELAVRLVRAGWEVTVYCRTRYTHPGEKNFKGVRLVRIPSLYTKYLETPSHTAFSVLHALGQRYDAALLVNGANAAFAPLLRLARTPVALHVDGIERKRAKWSAFGRSIYAISERLATAFPSAVVTDAESVAAYYRERFATEATLIGYGVEPEPLPPGPTLAKLGLEPRRYFLYVSRFEPENNPHRVVEAYRQVGGDLPLVMVGNAPYARDFIAGFRRRADARVVFPGSVYGDGYRELLSNSFAFVQATEVGGIHPALVEAMGYRNCVVVNDTPENREAAGEAGLYFDARRPASLARQLESLRLEPERARDFGRRAAARAEKHFSWDRVAEKYARLFEQLAARGA